tara:strand:- start:300 stop:758 length:459 start_codon:yes stop_codon:yes gene_type:complete
MKDFERLLNNVNNLDLNDIFYTLWNDNKVQQYIIRLNTAGEKTSQLYNLGVDSLGKTLGDYTDYTVQMKMNGDGDKRVDHITLIDSGGFYNSFIVAPSKKGFKISSNPIMDDGTDLLDRFPDVEGLTKENEEVLLAFVEKDFNKEFEKRLFQ